MDNLKRIDHLTNWCKKMDISISKMEKSQITKLFYNQWLEKLADILDKLEDHKKEIAELKEEHIKLGRAVNQLNVHFATKIDELKERTTALETYKQELRGFTIKEVLREMINGIYGIEKERKELLAKLDSQGKTEKKLYSYLSDSGKYIYTTPKKRPDLMDEVLGTTPIEVKLKKDSGGENINRSLYVDAIEKEYNWDINYNIGSDGEKAGSDASSINHPKDVRDGTLNQNSKPPELSEHDKKTMKEMIPKADFIVCDEPREDDEVLKSPYYPCGERIDHKGWVAIDKKKQTVVKREDLQWLFDVLLFTTNKTKQATKDRYYKLKEEYGIE